MDFYLTNNVFCISAFYCILLNRNLKIAKTHAITIPNFRTFNFVCMANYDMQIKSNARYMIAWDGEKRIKNIETKKKIIQYMNDTKYIRWIFESSKHRCDGKCCCFRRMKGWKHDLWLANKYDVSRSKKLWSR